MKSKSKVLVAYYSRTGNTERAARDLSIALNADIEKITDKTNRKGILGYIFGGRDALTKRKTGIEKFIHNPIHYSLIIIGTPIWAGNITPA